MNEWGVFELEFGYGAEVLLMAEERLHESLPSCACGPCVEEYGARILIIHNRVSN